VPATITAVDGGTLIGFDGRGTFFLVGISAASITSADFVFG
jgi:hypothetical protein